MANSRLDGLKAQRLSLISWINTFKNEIECIEREKKKCTAKNYQRRIEMLEKYQNKAQDLQMTFAEHDPEDEFDWIALEVRIMDLTDRFEIQLDTLNELQSKKNREDDLSTLHRLPELKIPTFDGTRENYRRFIEVFSTFIDDNDSLSEYHKFYLLRKSLQGIAADAIADIPFESSKYKTALARLEERFNDKVETMHYLVSKLLSTTASPCTNAADVQRLCDDVRLFISLLENIGSVEDIFNAIVVHVVLSSLNNHFRDKYLEKSDLKNLPTWRNCLKILEDHCVLSNINSFIEKEWCIR